MKQMIMAFTTRSKRMRTVTRLLGLFMAVLCLTMLLPLKWSAPAHAATFTTTIYADKDKYLNDEGGYSYSAAGADTLLYVGDQAGYIYGINRTAVCFNLSDIAGKNISTAYLKIGVKYCSTAHNGGISIDVYGSNIDDWTEGDTSGSDTSFPSQNTLLTPSHYPIAFNNMPQIIWYSIDVTSFIQSEAAGDGMATLVLSPAITGSYYECYFNSREGSDPVQLLVDYKVPSAALSASSSITESNVSGKVVNVTLEDGVTFADNTLDKSNFSLNGAPFTISSVSYTDTTHCSLTLAYTGADFDSDKNIFVTIGSAELSAGSSLTTNTIAVLATNDSESLAAATDGMIAEGSENNEVINVTLSGGQWAATLTPSNWSVTGLPAGVSKGAVTRVDNTHATVTLSGNAIKDYDNDRTATISCTTAEYTDNTDGGNLMTSFTLTATNDAESITAATDGMIAEGSENGEVINVTLSGGQLADTLTPSNWTISGLPDGVSLGGVTRVDDTHAALTLSGNATKDYDNDITATVSCTKAEYTDNTGGGTLSANFILTAADDAESITAATDGMIAEGSENGEVINVTLSGGQLADTLTPSNWTISGLPDGVSLGGVTRVDDTHAALTLSGNATKDYDNDITATVSCLAAEYADNTGDGTISAGFTLTAVNDAESLSVDTDGAITEGTEDGEVITATLINGTFAQPIVPSNWTLTGLPDGVAKGSVTRVNAHTVTIALSGNARDYDSDRTVTVSCSADEYEDSTGNGALQGFFNLNANNDAESMSASGDGLISEGSEDGEVITVTLNGGAFVTTVTAANWTVSGLPGGVTKGAVTRINDNTVKITLSGNATEDYDNDLTLAVSCTAAEYMDSTGGGTLSSNGITIKALDDEESLSAVSSELISEGSENGKTIIAILAGGTFNNILTVANWTVIGLPEGVSIGEVKRIDKNTAGIKLSGNAVWDYDNDIAVTVICGGTECINNTHIGGLSAAGAVLTAINDEEKLTLNDDGSITEGAENGEVIIVTLTGGQFAKTLDAAGWTVGNLPKGVAKGSITRVDAHTVKIALSGNATEDYDNNIADIFVTCREGQYVSGSLPLTASIGVTLHAIVEKPTADDGDNDSENEHDAAASPSAGNSSSAEPSAAPTPSSTPTPTTSAQATGTISILKPLSVERDDETGLYVVVIDLSTLPKGTASIELNNGEVINVDEDSGVVRFEIIEEDIGKGGTIEITALDEEGVPLGNYKVQVKDASKAAADITKHAANILTTLLWIIGALFVAAAAVILTVILIKRKKTI